ncbi:unnamed protein product [Parajaminaea phylloscopi]
MGRWQARQSQGRSARVNGTRRQVMHVAMWPARRRRASDVDPVCTDPRRVRMHGRKDLQSIPSRPSGQDRGEEGLWAMFKRPPSAKTATVLRSSARRHLLAHLTKLYPVLESCPPELVAQVCPESVKHFVATTSAGHKVVVYTGSDSRPWWWEAGNDAGAWINSKSTQKTPELLPTVHTLWLVPNLLPVLPTWPQVVDPALLGGSALMVPGLIPPPNTYRTSEAHPSRPLKGQLVSIVAYPSEVPLVLARTEMDVAEAERLRAEGAKGKAAAVLHCVGDALADLSGKHKAPDAVTQICIKRELIDAPVPGPSEATSVDAEVAPRLEDLAVAEDEASGGRADPEVAADGHLTASDVDAILYVALLSALQDITAGDAQASGSAALFPMASSTFYSSYVLPHRPSHWPPRPAKGKRAKQAKGKGMPGCCGGESDIVLRQHTSDEAAIVDAESAVVGKSSSKKLAKWIKSCNKSGSSGSLLRLKESKGEVTIIGIESEHEHVKNLSPFMTIAERAAAELPPSAAADGLSAGSQKQPVEAASSASAINTKVYIERLLQPAPGNAIVRSFLGDILNLPTKGRQQRRDDFYSAAEVRTVFASHINTACEPLKANQGLVRASEVLNELFASMAPSSASGGPSSRSTQKSYRREELHALFLSQCFKEHVRVARLRELHAMDIIPAASTSAAAETKTKKPATATGTPPLPSTELYDPSSAQASSTVDDDAYVSKVFPLPKQNVQAGTGSSGHNAASAHHHISPYKPVKITTKKRQGNKVVTLVFGLEVVRIDAKIWGQEVMRSLGTSVSVTPLPTSSKGAGGAGGLNSASAASVLPHEVLVQGDQRAWLTDKLVEQNGLPRSAVDVEGVGEKGTKKK